MDTFEKYLGDPSNLELDEFLSEFVQSEASQADGFLDLNTANPLKTDSIFSLFDEVNPKDCQIPAIGDFNNGENQNVDQPFITDKINSTTCNYTSIDPTALSEHQPSHVNENKNDVTDNLPPAIKLDFPLKQDEFNFEITVQHNPCNSTANTVPIVNVDSSNEEANSRAPKQRTLKPKMYQRTTPYDNPKLEAKRLNAIKAHRARLAKKEKEQDMQQQLKDALQAKEILENEMTKFSNLQLQLQNMSADRDNWKQRAQQLEQQLQLHSQVLQQKSLKQEHDLKQQQNEANIKSLFKVLHNGEEILRRMQSNLNR